ncbi:MAG: hypothetical protein ACP5QK_08500, partial [Myxococcota bacterium]
KKLIEVYKNELRQKIEITSDIIEGSPKIYIYTVKNYLKDFHLEKRAKKNFRDVIPNLLDNLYNYGKEQILERISINIEFIEKCLKENNEQSIERNLKSIRKKIEIAL